MSNRLPVLAAEIRRAHADVQEAAKTAAERAIVAGHALIEAKGLVQHGGWLPWLKDHCALAERTAQLYMKLARSGHSADLVSQLGLAAAAGALTLRYDFHQPLHDGDEETQREWVLFAIHLVKRGWDVEGAETHIDWIGRHDFKTVAEWLTEGPQWAARWGQSMNSDHGPVFEAFCAEYDSFKLSDLREQLEGLAAKEPAPAPPKRRRKSATVADLGGAR